MAINKEIAERLKGLREMEEIGSEEMAEVAGVSLKEYKEYESGDRDFNFTLLYKCAARLNIDFTELVTGITPSLSGYSVVKKGEGMPIRRREGFEYLHLARYLKDRIAEPFMVTAPYIAEQQDKPIRLSTHEGQEMDFVLEGSMKVQIEDKTEILNAGDTIYYDSSRPHGMIAVGGSRCVFLAIVMKR